MMCRPASMLSSTAAAAVLLLVLAPGVHSQAFQVRWDHVDGWTKERFVPSSTNPLIYNQLSSKNKKALYENAKKTGVTGKHLIRLQQWAEDNQVALIIRPSEIDSMNLIDFGFGTKSVDIKDKSSNWGPQRGTVTIDPFFNKKRGTKPPNPNLGEMSVSKDDEKTTHKPHADILEIRNEDIKLVQHKSKKNGLKKGTDPSAVQLSLPDLWWKDSVKPTLEKIGKKTLSGKNPSLDLGACKEGIYQDSSSPSVYFCVGPHEGLEFPAKAVWWFQLHSTAVTPLYVWAYHKVPITGDYDLWAVCPHIRKSKQLGRADPAEFETISTPVSSKTWGGSMTTSLYEIEALHSLNDAVLQDGGQRTFNHGPEMANYHFVQFLDQYLTIIVPFGLKPVKIAGESEPFILKTGSLDTRALGIAAKSLAYNGFFLGINPLYNFMDQHFNGQTSYVPNRIGKISDVERIRTRKKIIKIKTAAEAVKRANKFRDLLNKEAPIGENLRERLKIDKFILDVESISTDDAYRHNAAAFIQLAFFRCAKFALELIKDYFEKDQDKILASLRDLTSKAVRFLALSCSLLRKRHFDNLGEYRAMEKMCGSQSQRLISEENLRAEEDHYRQILFKKDKKVVRLNANQRQLQLSRHPIGVRHHSYNKKFNSTTHATSTETKFSSPSDPSDSHRPEFGNSVYNSDLSNIWVNYAEKDECTDFNECLMLALMLKDPLSFAASHRIERGEDEGQLLDHYVQSYVDSITEEGFALKIQYEFTKDGNFAKKMSEKIDYALSTIDEKHLSRPKWQQKWMAKCEGENAMYILGYGSEDDVVEEAGGKTLSEVKADRDEIWKLMDHLWKAERKKGRHLNESELHVVT